MIEEIIKEYKNTKEPLIEILHKVMDNYGYISKENIEIISKNLGISTSKIYGVITFYKDFKTNPVGKYQISVCLGTVCYIKGGKDIVDEIYNIIGIHDGETTKDGKFSLDTSRCLGCCSMAPVMRINDKVYGNLKKEDIKRILEGLE